MSHEVAIPVMACLLVFGLWKRERECAAVAPPARIERGLRTATRTAPSALLPATPEPTLIKVSVMYPHTPSDAVVG